MKMILPGVNSLRRKPVVNPRCDFRMVSREPVRDRSQNVSGAAGRAMPRVGRMEPVKESHLSARESYDLSFCCFENTVNEF
jgi:hypothetical protein